MIFRRNPDAVALLAIGLFLFALSIPRMMVQRTHWAVTPLKMELQADTEEMRAVRDQIRAQQNEIRAAADCLRQSLHR